MKNFTMPLLAFVMMACAAEFAAAQTEETSPNTETAFLNYDFRFQTSGFERMAGGPISLEPGKTGVLNFTFDREHDYVFIAIADTLTRGIGINAKPVEFNNDMIETDSAALFTEFGSRVVVQLIPDEMKGNVEFRTTLLGKAKPKESSYYLVMRKPAQTE